MRSFLAIVAILHLRCTGVNRVCDSEPLAFRDFASQNGKAASAFAVMWNFLK